MYAIVKVYFQGKGDSPMLAIESQEKLTERLVALQKSQATKIEVYTLSHALSRETKWIHS